MERDAAREGVLGWPPDKLLIRAARFWARFAATVTHRILDQLYCLFYTGEGRETVLLFSDIAMAPLVTLFKNSTRGGAHCRYASHCRCTPPLSLRLAWTWSGKILAVKKWDEVKSEREKDTVASECALFYLR